MGRSHDLATGVSYQDQTETDARYHTKTASDAAFVAKSGDTITGDTVIATTTQNQFRIENTAANSLGSYMKIRDGNSTAGQHTWIGRSTNDTYIYSNNSDIGMKITNAGQVTKPKQPAFYAWTTNDNQSSGVYMTAAAGTTWGESFDQGNNFTGGVFTAPVAGKYYFSIMWNRNSVQSRLDLRKNNNNYLRFEPTGRTDDVWETMHYSAMMQMAANDYANLYLTYSGTSSHPAHMGGGAWGHFGGYLMA